MDISAALTAPFVPADSVPGQVTLCCGGVARNIAHNLRLMGHDVKFVSAFGSETFGEMCWSECEAIGLDLTQSERCEGMRNGLYLCVNDQTGDMIAAVADTDIVDHITPEFLAARIETVNASAVVVADTNISTESLRYLIDHCSSQFLSALLISSCLSPSDFTVEAVGSHGMAYVEMTRKMMAQFGVRCDAVLQNASQSSSDSANAVPAKRFVTPAGQKYRALDYQIEPDVSGASYFYALCPLLNLPVQVSHVHFDSLQGDIQFLRFLEQLGCHAEDRPEGILLTPPGDGSYPGIVADMSACSDQAITLAALAPFATSPTTITGIGHVRFQESDRLSAIETELKRMGIRCETTDGSITIWPGSPKPSLVKTYEDHRMAMGFTLIGLRSPGIVIDDPACCKKTFENYFEVLEKVLCISSSSC